MRERAEHIKLTEAAIKRAAYVWVQQTYNRTKQSILKRYKNSISMSNKMPLAIKAEILFCPGYGFV
jgi:hypothetical protein